MELSKILRGARDKKGLLLREVAALIKVDTAMISKFENGDRNPTRPQILRLTEDEAILLYPKIKEFKQRIGEVPSIQSNDQKEKRMPEALIFLRELKKKRALENG